MKSTTECGTTMSLEAGWYRTNKCGYLPLLASARKKAVWEETDEECEARMNAERAARKAAREAKRG